MPNLTQLLDHPRTAWLIWIVLILLLFLGLGSYDLSAPDEPRYALVAREMIEGGHWLFLHRNGQLYPDKPPLFFWLIAGFSLLNGGEVNAWTARLPSAFAALGVLLIFAQWYRRVYVSNRVTHIGLLTLATAAIFFFQARNAQIDMLLCLLIQASLYLAWLDIQSGQKCYRWAIGLLWGASILAKGPVGYLIPAGSLALYLIFSKQHKLRAYPLSALLWGLLLPAIWLASLVLASATTHQWDYLNNLVFKQTMVRYFNAWHHHKPWWFFLRVLISDFMPWSLLLLAAIPWRKRDRQELDEWQRFGWAVIVFTLCFFSLSKGKRNLYILPLYPMASVLVTRMIVKDGAKLKARGALSFGLLITTLIGAFLTAVAFEWVSLPKIENASMDVPTLAGWFGIAMLLISVAGLAATWRAKPIASWSAIVLSMVLLHSFVYQSLMPKLGPHRSARQFMSEVQQRIPAASEVPLGMIQFRAAYRFYGDRDIIELQSPEPEYAHLIDAPSFTAQHPDGWIIVRESQWLKYPEDYRQKYEIAYQRTVGNEKQMLLLKPTM